MFDLGLGFELGKFGLSGLVTCLKFLHNLTVLSTHPLEFILMLHCELFDLDHMLFGHGLDLDLVVLLEGGEGRGEILLGSGLSLGQILKVGFMSGFEVG